MIKIITRPITYIILAITLIIFFFRSILGYLLNEISAFGLWIIILENEHVKK